ncbi:Saccharopine dehydrogenase [Actinomortierella ambigua]|uniref:Saccharopine dehydrogenase [NAD(+), L-lysine-forming] n=1 Tax=Actinomortierella ambigua TaxID=1343610 RepID=A0A9P6UCP5_9FUNG|nr:Saccharopine dehydrogenase [Actinomortierella ambigua]
MVYLWLRAETKPMEHRAALTPSTCKTLLDRGFKITVERSPERIFDDEEYAKVGCHMVPIGEWRKAPRNAYIVGLKELPEGETDPLEHTHIFFAHCFKNQGGWTDILGRFDAGKGTILDLEFLNDDQGRRVAAFGYHAGFAGAAIGVDNWCHQKLNPGQPLPGYKPFPNEGQLISYIKERLGRAVALNGGELPEVMVMGALGRCGRGATDLARAVGIPEEKIISWDLNETKAGGPFPRILQAEIFVNCIYLNQPIPPFFTKEMLDGERKLSAIVDVSCDTTNPHNPIPVYSINTTFESPVVAVPSKNPLPLDVCSIDHLPTLLPRESSEAFSRDLLPTIINLEKRHESAVWNRAEALFHQKVQAMRDLAI